MTIKELGWPAVGAMVAALVTGALLATSQLELMLLSFPLSLLGLVCLGLAVWQTRRWWLFVFAPILMVPLAMWIFLLVSCARGDCL